MVFNTIMIMKLFFMIFIFFFPSSTFAEIKDKELLNSYNEGCLGEDVGSSMTVGEQFLVCGCLTSEISKEYTIDELLDDEDYVETEKFNNITNYCISVILDRR